MTEWIIPCNIKHYDVIGAFNHMSTLNWKQSTNIKVGDTVYIYVSKPLGAIKYKTKVNAVDLTSVQIDDSEFVIHGSNYKNHGRYMELELIETFDDNLFTYDELKSFGLKSIKGPSKIKDNLSEFMFTKTHANKNHNYFFVFQNKSFKEEYSGGYLWAPQHNKSGGKVSHWEQMKNVKKDDFILHSFLKEIVSISVALTDVYEANKPSNTGVHDEWQNKGWRVDTDYHIISKPITTSEHMDKILKLQPVSDAPFNKIGRGNTGYLFKANKGLFEYIITETLKNNISYAERETLNRLLYDNVPAKEENLLDQNLFDDIDTMLINEDKEDYIYTPEPKDKPNPTWMNGKKIYPRNRQTAMNALIRAKHKCEVNPSHPSFIRRSTGKNYSEPHHLIPLAYQDLFEKSLDVKANIVSLCSNCHNEIHYGKYPDRIIDELYALRKDELDKTGISITSKKLKELYY